MNKLNLHSPSLTHPSEAETDTAIRWLNLETSRRLLVLIPANSNCASVTRRIWELANATGSAVQLLGLCKDADQEPALRRELVTLSALIQDAKISVETKFEIGTNWVDVVKRNYQVGDMIVCMANQRTGIQRKPLSQILEAKFRAPVYILSELYPLQPKSNWFSQAIVWSGFLAIIIGFFILQGKVTQLSKDGFQTVLLIFLLIPEFGLIWVWNNLFS